MAFSLPQRPMMRASRRPCAGRSAWLCAGFFVVLALLLPVPAAAAPAPEMDIVLVAEIHDLTGWLYFHQEVIGTPPASSKPLRLSLPGPTGGNRWLRVDQPKFGGHIVTYDGTRAVKLGISGKVIAAEAQSSLIAFQHSVLEVQSGTLANELTILYGLNGIVGRLLELHLSRP